MKRYLIKITVFDGYGEADAYELEADTLAEAEAIAYEHEVKPDEFGCEVTAEIVDRNIIGTVLPRSLYAKPGVVYEKVEDES